MTTNSIENRDLLYERIKILEEKYSSQKQMVEMTVNFLEQSNRELEVAKNEIEKVNTKVFQSIHYAERIQKSILPPSTFLNKYFIDSFILFKPKDIVSGDFHWSYENENSFYFAVIDCTGHGVPGAFLTVIVNSLLNKILEQNLAQSPQDILLQLDKLLYEYIHHDEISKRTRDGLDISLCCYDKLSNDITFSSTHQTIFLSRNGEIIEYRGAAYSIGEYSKRRKNIYNAKLEYLQGDILYLSSDGFQDQFGGSDNQKFKRKNFRTLLKKVAHLPMKNQSEVILKTFEKWKENNFQTDDILILGLQF